MNKINRMISNYNYNPGNISRIKYIVIHYAEHRKIVHTMVVATVGHLHTILSVSPAKFGSAWKIGISPGIVGRAVTNIRNAETLIALGLRCVCERRMRRVLGQPTRTGTSKRQQYSLLLS